MLRFEPFRATPAGPESLPSPSPHELETARRVQERLLLQDLRPLRSLDYWGHSLPVGTVGGDYFDFLDGGPGRLGLALGDVSGKGVSAALMMAGLQASLRSLYPEGAGDLGRLLAAVNRLFRRSTAEQHYASLFLGDYDDATRRLRYVNCGHPSPALVHPDGRLERLGRTATVLGLFEDWDCSVAEVALDPGSVLLLFTDGATEATNRKGEELGEPRLIEWLHACRHLPAASLVWEMQWAVRRFSAGHLQDDLTVVAARALPPAPCEDGA